MGICLASTILAGCSAPSPETGAGASPFAPHGSVGRDEAVDGFGSADDGDGFDTIAEDVGGFGDYDTCGGYGTADQSGGGYGTVDQSSGDGDSLGDSGTLSVSKPLRCVHGGVCYRGV